MVYDQIKTAPVGVCCSKILITHSAYQGMDLGNYSKDLFESIPDYIKIVYLLSRD